MLAVTVIGIACTPLTIEQYGIYRHADIIARSVYPFLHVNFLHALCNAWCLLSIVFCYNATLGQMMTAYGVAITVPSGLLCDTPTVGMSGLCFALMGVVMQRVRRKRLLHLWVLAFIAMGLLFPNVNVQLHLYCFYLGIVLGFLFVPAPWLKK